MASPTASPHTLVIRCPNWVGDVVMATPAFACLRAGFPPGAKFGSSKCWPPGHFARLIELLTEHNSAVKVLLLIGPNEATKEGLLDEDRALSARFVKEGLSHYAIKYNPFMGVISDYFTTGE